MESLPNQALSTSDHSRNAVGLKYVYPVISRRAGGVSIGINLNTNNACNWACSYCQVPDLTRGRPEPVDLDRLEREFEGFLAEVLHGRFMVDRVPPDQRRLIDVAFSGNGEPTASHEFGGAVERILKVLAKTTEMPPLKGVVISNGSHVLEWSEVFRRLAAHRGELWFKLDRGTSEERSRVNGVDLEDETVVRRLVAVSAWIPTWLQTCVFAENGLPPSDEARVAWQRLVHRALEAGADLKGVHLYTLARPSLQPGAQRLFKVDDRVLAAWGHGLPIQVRISP